MKRRRRSERHAACGVPIVDIPAQIRKDVLAWVGCIAGALDENDYRAKLAAAGFEAAGVESTRVHKVEDARVPRFEGFDVDAMAKQVDGKFMSAFVRATKPQAVAKAGCSGPMPCN